MLLPADVRHNIINSPFQPCIAVNKSLFKLPAIFLSKDVDAPV